MVRFNRNCGILLMYLFCLTTQIKGQCPTTNKAFKAGEYIEYNLYFNYKFVWIKAGTANLKTLSTTWKSEPAYKIELISTGNKKTDFFFKMRDTITSVITKDLEPRYYRKGALEGKTYTLDQAWFSNRNGLCYVNQSRHKKEKRTCSEYKDNRCIYDMLSFLALARSFSANNYKIGQKIYFPMATGKEVEQETLIYRGKKNIKAENDTIYRCLVFSFVEYKGNKEKEIITFHITDDNNHLPVRLDLYLNFGSAKAFLHSARGNRYPITAVVSK